jgi:hypothetical protein
MLPAVKLSCCHLMTLRTGLKWKKDLSLCFYYLLPVYLKHSTSAVADGIHSDLSSFCIFNCYNLSKGAARRRGRERGSCWLYLYSTCLVIFLKIGEVRFDYEEWPWWPYCACSAWARRWRNERISSLPASLLLLLFDFVNRTSESKGHFYVHD